MKPVTGALLMLAALGGCTATQQESDVGRRVTYDYRQQVPRPADPSWTSNSKTMTYANGPMAPYTRIGPPGTPPQGTMVASAAGANPQTPTVNKTPTMLPAATTDLAGNLTKPTAPATSDRSATDKTQDKPALDKTPGPLAVKDAAPSDPFALKSTIAATIAKSDAKTAEILGGTPSQDPSSTSKPKSATTASASTSKSDMALTTSYLPNRTAEVLELGPSAPPMRIVNNKRITLNYKINDVGPSGVSGIDVWVTHDSRVWKKLDVGTQTHPPCIVEVSDEGVYGFTLLARNGFGMGKAPPQAGDAPQVWVDVDLTRPAVHLLGVDASANGKPELVIRWNATDKNLGPKPITLSYADQAKGPWTPIAANLENTGRYIWHVAGGVTGGMLVRVEAIDLAGNVGSSQSAEPVLIDKSQPTIAILNVEAGK